jgi:hypothetical protein
MSIALTTKKENAMSIALTTKKENAMSIFFSDRKMKTEVSKIYQ